MEVHSEAPGDVLQRRVERIVVLCGVHLPVQIGQNQRGMDRLVLLFQLPHHRGGTGVKPSVPAQEEIVRFATNQPSTVDSPQDMCPSGKTERKSNLAALCCTTERSSQFMVRIQIRRPERLTLSLLMKQKTEGNLPS